MGGGGLLSDKAVASKDSRWLPCRGGLDGTGDWGAGPPPGPEEDAGRAVADTSPC